MPTLGFRSATVAIDNSGLNPYGNGLWVGQIPPKTWAVGADKFEVYHMSLRGPAGSTLEVWIDSDFYDTTPRGDLNSWDPKQPLTMTGGQTLYFFWNSNAAPANSAAPVVTVWIRTPSPL